MLNNYLRKVRHFLSSGILQEQIFARQDKIYQAIQAQLPILYLIFSYFAFLQVLHNVYTTEELVGPGPFFFVEYYTPFLYLFFRWLPAPLLIFAAYFNKNALLGRLALFAFVQQGALVNAIDVNENGYRPAIWLAIALMFMPLAKNNSRVEKAKVINHYWFSLMLFSFCYAVAGFWKIAWGGVYQLFFDNFGFWNYQSMSYIIEEYMLRTALDLPGGRWVSSVPVLGWILLWIAIYAEATIWIVFFRPSLWKLYGALMVFLHMGSKFTLNIGFEPQYLLTSILFFASPFSRPQPLKETLLELPGVKFVHQTIKKSSNVISKDRGRCTSDGNLS